MCLAFALGQYPELVDHSVGRVGDKFFKLDPLSYSDEMTGPQREQYMAMSKEDRQIFVLRHEAEHMSAHNIEILNSQEIQGYAAAGYKDPKEIDASTKAMEWMK